MGSIQKCSCKDTEICIHILFVMLKILKIPKDNPIVYQKGLIESEITRVLRGDFSARINTGRRSTMHRCSSDEKPETLTEGVVRQQVSLEEVCAICQDDMNCDKPLTYCKLGCGNNFHIQCSRLKYVA